jgi:endonuclease/exonuclease/phosphatase family metal-dependent hydrolase
VSDADVRIVRVVSYNVHRCIGLDRRKDVGRVAAVLAEARPDLVAVQEAEALSVAGTLACQIEELARRLDLTPVHGPTIVSHDGRYGNGLLTRFPVVSLDRLDLSFRRREPRGALDVRLDADGHPLRVVCTHLGLRSAERVSQLERITATIDHAGDGTLVLLGDFNEWRGSSRLLAPLRERFGAPPRPATYPSFRPLLPLDRAFVSPQPALREVSAHRSALASQASDHLPLVAVLELRPTHEARARLPA